MTRQADIELMPDYNVLKSLANCRGSMLLNFIKGRPSLSQEIPALAQHVLDRLSEQPSAPVDVAELKREIKEIPAIKKQMKMCDLSRCTVNIALSRAIDHLAASGHLKAALTSPRTVPEGWVLVPREPTENMRLVGENYKSSHVKVIYQKMIDAAPSAQDDKSAGNYLIEHDGFKGDVIGHYVTREGKRGVVLQQDGTRVVHVYGEKWLKPAQDDQGRG